MRRFTLGLFHSYNGVQTAVGYEATHFQHNPSVASGNSHTRAGHLISTEQGGNQRNTISAFTPGTSWFPKSLDLKGPQQLSEKVPVPYAYTQHTVSLYLSIAADTLQLTYRMFIFISGFSGLAFEAQPTNTSPHCPLRASTRPPDVQQVCGRDSNTPEN